jgi:hypothetical protein
MQLRISKHSWIQTERWKKASVSNNDFKMYLSNHLCTEESNQPCGQQLQVTALEHSVRKTQLVF